MSDRVVTCSKGACPTPDKCLANGEMCAADDVEVLDVEIIIPEKADAPIERAFVASAPNVVQEAIAATAIFEIKNSLDAVHLFHSETVLPQAQSMCATYHIARAYLQDALNALEPLGDASLTPSVRGWRLVARDSLEKLKILGPPDHTKPSDLEQVARIVTEFLTQGHTMLAQSTKSSDRRKLAALILAGINETALLEGKENGYVQ